MCNLLAKPFLLCFQHKYQMLRIYSFSQFLRPHPHECVFFEYRYFPMRFGFSSTLKRLKTDAFLDENESIKKRPQKWRHLKTQAYRF